MTEQTVARYFCALLVVGGLVILCMALADRPWLVGIVLVVVGTAIGVPFWKWHLDAEAEARELARLQPMKVPDEEPQV